MPEATQEISLEAYILEHLDDALEQGHIKVYYQPVIRTVSRQLCGLEALARWDDPLWGLLPPDRFISILEKHRRIHHLDSFMVREVCACYRKTVLNHGAPLPVSINLSRLDYELCDIFEVVEAAVQANKVPRKSLCIEITESALNDQASLMRYYIERFRGAGYQVWMDDFGSGYSSLNVLKDYQFDELKIDMAFLSDFHLRSKEILSSIVHMAKEIDIQTLVEGVETEEQFEFLRNIGCEKVQGFLFGKPLPYMECIRQVLEKGVSIEPPVYRKYYDDIGRLNVLSATPFLSAVDKKTRTTGRDRNSIPLAVLELRGDSVRLLFSNDAFDETASGLDWHMIFGAPREYLVGQDTLRLKSLSSHLVRLLEEARASGSGKMYFVDKDEYYEMQAKRIAEYNETSSILVSVVNLSRGAEITRQETLDEGLRQIYSMYDRVSLLDLEKGSGMPLYLDSKEETAPQSEDLRQVLEGYAQDFIFPEDRRRYLQFTNPDTLEERVLNSGRGYISAYLRTRLYHGNFVWKLYLLLRVRDRLYFLMIRDAGDEIREFLAALDAGNSGDVIARAAEFNARAASEPAGEAPEKFLTPSLLWENFQRCGALKMFWKDKDRRFRGASQSFLDFYGFQSLEDILGKTDEDMGWHLHPDLYRSDEWNVIREGIPTHDVLGNCIARGESRNIIASKMPLYDGNGQICGLLGYFSEVDAPEGPEERDERARRDALTGLLSARGVEEALYAYRDEYDLRKRDYARIHVSITDFSDVNRQYGYDFGDRLIRTVANAILSCCGNAASVGRVQGAQFVVLYQFENHAELDALTRRIREIPSQIQDVGGIPFTPYLAVGVSIFSEANSEAEQAEQAQVRMMTDDSEYASLNGSQDNIAHLFRTFDHIPLAYAVYKVHFELEETQGADGVTRGVDHGSGAGKKCRPCSMDPTDVTILYANYAFCRMTGRDRQEISGRKMSELFPMLGRDWFQLACRAAILGEVVQGRLRYPFLDLYFDVTANQVIGTGYCAFAYQKAADAKESEKAKETEEAEEREDAAGKAKKTEIAENAAPDETPETNESAFYKPLASIMNAPVSSLAVAPPRS